MGTVNYLWLSRPLFKFIITCVYLGKKKGGVEIEKNWCNRCWNYG